MSNRWWTTGETRWLRAHYRELGLAACVKHLRRSRDAVMSMASRLGIVSRPRLTACVKGRMKVLHSYGYNDRDIAIELGIGRGSVIRWRHRAGHPPNRNPGRTNNRVRARVLELHVEGKTIDQIATTLGRHYCNVWRMLRRMGEQPNRARPVGRRVEG